MLLTSLVLLGGAALVGRLLFEEPDEASTPGPDHEPEERPGDDEEVDESLAVAAVGGVAAVIGATVLPVANIVALGSILYTSVDLVEDAYESLARRHKPNMATLDVCAIAISLHAHLWVISSAALMIYFGSQKLNLLTRTRARDELTDAFAKQPEEVWLLENGVELRVPLTRVRTGDVISVNASEVVPVDGRVVAGTGGVDEHALTGEALPAEKGRGDRVFATTLLLSGRLMIRVVEAGADTQARQIEEALRQSASFEHRLVEHSERLADATAPPTVGISAVALLGLGPAAGLAVLMSNYMGALRLATPLSMYGTLRRAARAGLFIKDGRSLQLIAEIDTIVFDKTGTLTASGFTVERVHVVTGSRERALILAAAAEVRQSHPIAKALVAEAAASGLEVPPQEEVCTHLGNGVQARVQGEEVLVGSARFLESANVMIPAHTAAYADLAAESGHSVVYLALGGELAAVFELAPIVRSGAKELVASLRQRGLDVYVLSGDRASPTRRLAEEFGAVGYFAEVLPLDKARVIAGLRSEGRRVCFVGDGLNDALALREADLSVSLSDASGLAINNAQVILMDEDLRALETLLGLGHTFSRDQRLAHVSVAGPSVIAVGGVFLAGFGFPTVSSLYLASASLGTLIGLLPVLRRAPMALAGVGGAAAESEVTPARQVDE